MTYPPFSLPTKETLLQVPSLSPPDHPFSPHVLTPESDPARNGEIFTFAKQPIHKPSSQQPVFASPPLSAIGSDSETGFSDDQIHSDSRQPVSLLTTLLHSSDNQPFKKGPPSSGGLTSAKSSVPSTAFSSPAGRHHGILHQIPPNTVMSDAKVLESDKNIPPTSILRRGSVGASSDGGEVMGLGLGLSMTGIVPALPNAAANGAQGLDGLHNKLEKVEERREKVGWADEIPTHETAVTMTRAPSSRACALKFAVAQPVSNHSSDSGEASTRRQVVSHDHGFKWDTSTKRPPSPFARERAAQGEMPRTPEDENDEEQDQVDEEEDEGSKSEESEEILLPGYRRSPRPFESDLGAGQNQSDSEDDLGYLEDEEDGAFSDEEEVTGIFSTRPSKTFAFARPTNYLRRRRGERVASPTPPPAPAILPPPMRRGRGHIRVVDPTLPTGKESKGCSRHCSPPPARGRSNSNSIKALPAAASPSARKLAFGRRGSRSDSKGKEKSSSPSRLSDAGPREGRAGSPMPPRFSYDSDMDEEDEEDEYPALPSPQATPPRTRGGWRSDDSIFYGANSQQTRGILPMRLESMSRNISAPPTRVVFESDDEEEEEAVPLSVPMEHSTSVSGMGEGVREFLRRASEHLPIFRRPLSPNQDNESFVVIDQDRDSPPRQTFDHAVIPMPRTAPMLSQATCPPALDDTPAIARSASRNGAYPGLTHRLEKTLSNQPVYTLSPVIPLPQPQPLNRASTVSGKVTFSNPPLPRSAAPARAVSHTLSADEGGRKREMLGSSPGFTGGMEKKVKSKPIACPKGKCNQEDLGWSDDALKRIRKNVGKDEMM